MALSRFTVNAAKTGVNLRYAPKKASTAMTIGTLLGVEVATGQLIPAVNTLTYVKGVAVERIAATDADFAATTEIAYDEPREGELFVMDVDNTATALFFPGVSRTINNAGQIKAAVKGAGEFNMVRIHKILSATTAVVSLITMTNNDYNV